MARAAVYGGALDGAIVEGTLLPFAWVGVSRAGTLRPYGRRRAGRSLHRLDDRGRYVPATGYSQCAGCGSWTSGPCRFCP